VEIAPNLLSRTVQVVHLLVGDAHTAGMAKLTDSFTVGCGRTVAFQTPMNALLFSRLTNWSLKMLAAKLFAALSVLQVGLAVLESRTTPQPIDIGVHGTYLVVGRIELQIMLALASACFALTYFAASRWVSYPLNNSLGLMHFAIATIGFVFLLLSLYTLTPSAPANGLPDQAPNHWPLFALLAGVLCFLSGCATLTVNCIWTTLTTFWSH
jgi:heme/copper-type cytochrome/quinol oxidase subunit 1